MCDAQINHIAHLEQRQSRVILDRVPAKKQVGWGT